jgi:hypothetical protein
MCEIVCGRKSTCMAQTKILTDSYNIIIFISQTDSAYKWKMSTANSIKHRILATFNMNKKKINLSDCMPLTIELTEQKYLTQIYF